jgi:low affinity Fe/Cu permease
MRHRLQIDLRDRYPGRSDQRVHNGNAAETANVVANREPERADPRRRARSSVRGSNGRDSAGETSEPQPKKGKPQNELFRRFAHLTSTSVARPWAFALACGVVLIWAVSGPLFRFSDTWQLVINTGTTIITFLMVFLIQNTQNRDAIALHLKLDEIIRAMKGARNQLVDIEELSDEELEKLRREFRRLGAGTPASHPYVRDKDS